MLVKLGVPYADAWGMPALMALDMLGVTPTGSKSKQVAPSIANQPLPSSLVQNNQVTAPNTTRKLVAARRKSKSL